MKKRLVSLFVAGLFTYIQLFSWGVLTMERRDIQAKNSTYLPSFQTGDALVSFTFSSTQVQALEWEHDKEFKFEGTMYDVVSKTAKGDSLVLVCYADMEESQLVKEIEEICHFIWGSKSKTKTETKNQEPIDLFFSPLSPVPTFFITLIQQRHYLYLFHFSSVGIPTFSLPPERS